MICMTWVSNPCHAYHFSLFVRTIKRMFIEEDFPMYCARCGAHNQDGAHFCQNCGNALQAPGAVLQQPPIDPYPIYAQEEQVQAPVRRRTRGVRTARPIQPQDPYQDQIKQLKLQIKQMKLYLKQVNTINGLRICACLGHSSRSNNCKNKLFNSNSSS